MSGRLGKTLNDTELRLAVEARYETAVNKVIDEYLRPLSASELKMTLEALRGEKPSEKQAPIMDKASPVNSEEDNEDEDFVETRPVRKHRLRIGKPTATLAGE